MKLNLHHLASTTLGAACLIKAWQRGGNQTALAVAVGIAILLAMIHFNHLFAAGLPRRGSSMLGTPQAHHVQPVVFAVIGWGILIFMAWVLFNPR
jgi:hypothetical protein